MNDLQTTTRKSKYELSDYAHLKVPRGFYDILCRQAEPKNIHWSELARDYLAIQIKKKVVE